MRPHRPSLHRISLVAVVLAVAGGLAPLATAQSAPSKDDTRTPVRTADDLPRHTYQVEGTALEILKDKPKLLALADRLLKDSLQDLATYRIEDVATLKAYYDGISAIYTAKGDFGQALAYSDKARDLETKEQEKLLRGVTLRARIAATEAAKGDRAAFEAAFRAELKRAVSALPFEPIKDRLVAVRSQASMVSAQLVEASLTTSIDPLIAANRGTVPGEVIGALVQTHNTLEIALPVLPIMAEVYGEIIDANANAAKGEDRWTPRLVELQTSDPGTPVVVGVWDSGVDTALYPDNLWTNARETANGKDDDGNGFVDDLHGIAFGEDRLPTTGPLASLAGLKGDKEQLVGFIAASQDMQAGIQNAGVERFQAFYRNLKEEQLRDFTDDMSLLGSYVHGTHVAGITIAGNPFARIVHISENWPYKAIPDQAPTVELGRQWGISTKQAVEYLKQSGTRVVNMSWRVGRAAFEGMLQAKGVGATPEERAELSRQIFAGLRNGLEEAIRSAPEILFVAGSGNEDNDVDFAEYVPAGLRLPNLLTVGAVDDKDRFTDFTSTGKNVELYANGYRIKSLIPGGTAIEFSGTSMASPQVANLAAKILALRPTLKPAEVIELIRANADPIPGKDGRFIINPKRTIEAIRR